MRIPIVKGVIDRRILVNYRVDPELLSRLLPSPFRPKLIHGAGMAGICLIRLKRLRPQFLPTWVGFSSENAAHRVAVEWDDGGTIREGVYVRRRDTSSWWNTILGGRLFPGIHHHARFQNRETSESYEVSVKSDDGLTDICVRGRRVSRLPATSVFTSLEEASDFFQAGSIGYSATTNSSRHQGLELKCLRWEIEPLDVECVRSSFFDDETAFPNGTSVFDSAFLMRGIEHEWHGKPDLCCEIESSHHRPKPSRVTP